MSVMWRRAWHSVSDLATLELGAQGLSSSDRRGNAAGTRFPFRTLRYWFMYRMIREESKVRKRPLEILEAGVGAGAMLAFLKAAEVGRDGPSRDAIVGRWDGLNVIIDPVARAAQGYGRCLEQDLEGPGVTLPQRYDAILFLHVLEHLHDPEQSVARVLPFLKEGGVCLGGSPGIPHLLVRFRERQLRRTAQWFGHVSAFSPRRITTLAACNGLTVEWLSGAYLMRKTGSILENYAWWVRLNLVFGALLPSWPGELYWALRKPVPRGSCNKPGGR